MNDGKIVYREECFAIQGCIFEVYRRMGYGFLEPVYQECLDKEFRIRRVPFVSQKGCTVFYKGEALQRKYKPDFICYDKIVLEIKAAKELAPEHKAQILNYLKSTHLRLGLLVNFGHHPKAQIIRVVL